MDDIKNLPRQKDDTNSLMDQLESEYKKFGLSGSAYKEPIGMFSENFDSIEGKIKEIENPTVNQLMEKLFGKHKAPEEVRAKGKNQKFLRGAGENKEDPPPEEKPKEQSSEPEKKLEPGEIEEVTPEVAERLAKQMAEEAGATGASDTKEESSEEPKEEEDPSSKLEVELEKIKVMLDTMRETKQTTDETIRTMSESIGEIRSMVLQTDATLKEIEAKVQKTEDEIGEVKPTEISKKLRGFDTQIENINMTLEKFNTKYQDVSEKINKIHSLMQKMGGIENLIEINKHMKKKVDDVNEVMRYIQRLSLKVEKMFIEMNKNMEDFVTYKIKQDGMSDAVGDMEKDFDNMDVRLEGYESKKDIKTIEEDMILIKKQIEEINKNLPMTELKLPEPIIELRRERDDIKVFMDSLEDQLKRGKLSIGDYKKIKEENQKKIKNLNSKIKDAWVKIYPLLQESSEDEDQEIPVKMPEENPVNVKKSVENSTVKKDEKQAVAPDDSVNAEGNPENIPEDAQKIINGKGKNKDSRESEEEQKTTIKNAKIIEADQKEISTKKENLDNESFKKNINDNLKNPAEDEIKKPLEKSVKEIVKMEKDSVPENTKKSSEEPEIEENNKKANSQENDKGSMREKENVNETFGTLVKPENSKDLTNQREDIKSILGHLEDEYRNSNISEKSYQELKLKYSKTLEEMDKSMKSKDSSEESHKKKSNIVSSFFENMTHHKKKDEKKEKKSVVNVLKDISSKM